MDIIKKAYLELLDREVDKDGLETYMKLNLTETELREILTTSPEFLKINKQYIESINNLYVELGGSIVPYILLMKKGVKIERIQQLICKREEYMERRIKYYMGSAYTPIDVNVQKRLIGHGCIRPVPERSDEHFELEHVKERVKENINKLCHDTLLFVNRSNLENGQTDGNGSYYFSDLLKFIKCDNQFLFVWGDVYYELPWHGIITKSRQVGCEGVLMKLNTHRHWNVREFKETKNDFEFVQKKNQVVWRGVSTGQNHKLRFKLCEKFNNHETINVGLSKLCQKGKEEEHSHLIKAGLSIKDQLKYKFILSIEGNDVSSGLKWMLLSNSVVMMPVPTCVSWLMEDKLVPYVHYIPIKSDFSDLETQFSWGLSNESKCTQIAKNATLYMEQFMHFDIEESIQTEIMSRYFENVCINVS